MKIRVFLCVLASAACCIQAQVCRTPDGGLGICKHISDCPELIPNVNKIESSKIEDLSKRAVACSGNNINQKLCCSQCITPDGKSGIRKSFSDCPSLKKLLKTVTPKNAAYINNSRMKNTREYCCGPSDESQPEPQKAAGHRCDSAFASLPDPSTRCCGIEAGLSNKIVGGLAAGVYDSPWAVLFDFEDSRRCGGSLITNRHVLTAAHCFVDPNNRPPPKKLRVGELDRDNQGQDCQDLPDQTQECTDGAEIIPVESYLVHPEYKGNNNDIALARLSQPVKYTKFVRPICLPSLDYGDDRSTYDFIVTGWGIGDSGVGESYKQFVRVKLFDFQNCTQTYMRRYRRKLWNESQICAGGKAGEDSCGGDSGGPLMAAAEQHYELAGAVSFGPRKCGTKAVPAVYSNVYTHLDWIKQNIREHSQDWVTLNQN